jgi:hypothetical protein
MRQDDASLRERRQAVLRSLSRDEAALAEVSEYCANRFGEVRPPSPVFPLVDEPHVEDWRRYAAEAGDRPFEHLRERLPQLVIPVREGISKLPAYADVTLRGQPLDPAAFGGRLELAHPEEVRLLIHEHPAGALPVLVAADRGDFEALVRALAWRGEPRPISPAVNAQIVTGFVNWDRMRRYRATWAAQVDPAVADGLWPVEVARVAASERWRYQDRFVIIGVRPYSGVSAAQLGVSLSEEEWLERSTLLRVEHEFTHYATQRVFGAMSLNLLDETVADFMGTTYALGEFRADWYLRFLGLDAWPQVRPDGRVRTYAGELSPAGFELLAEVTVRAARGLEAVAARFYEQHQRGRFLLALAGLTLELLASDEAAGLFEDSYRDAGRLTRPSPGPS